MSEKSEDAAVAAVAADVFGHLVEGLCETKHAAVPVPAVDEIIEDAVLVALTISSSKPTIFWSSTSSSSSVVISSPSASMSS